MPNITSDQLLQHLFHEDEDPDRAFTTLVLAMDAGLQEEYETYTETIAALQTELLEPDDHLLRNILATFRHEADAHIA